MGLLCECFLLIILIIYQCTRKSLFIFVLQIISVHRHDVTSPHWKIVIKVEFTSSTRICIDIDCFILSLLLFSIIHCLLYKKEHSNPITMVQGSTVTPYFSTEFPATETRLIQYLEPFPSGKLWPKCVPSTLTVSPFFNTRTLSQTTSSSLNDGQP